MPRPDISDKLIHFTKGDSVEEAFQNLQNIVAQRCLRGSSNFIRGGYTCVCFSEAPLEALGDGLVNPDYYSKYSPFGIMIRKEWLFEQGGRPVIYQTNEEFENLPDSYKWRHVQYDPLSDPPIDFTWEREWRIQCEELFIDPDVASIVVPDEDWAGRIIQQHEIEQGSIEWENTYIFGYPEAVAAGYYEPFQWEIIHLG